MNIHLVSGLVIGLLVGGGLGLLVAALAFAASKGEPCEHCDGVGYRCGDGCGHCGGTGIQAHAKTGGADALA